MHCLVGVVYCCGFAIIHVLTDIGSFSRAWFGTKVRIVSCRFGLVFQTWRSYDSFTFCLGFFARAHSPCSYWLAIATVLLSSACAMKLASQGLRLPEAFSVRQALVFIS